MMSLSKPRGFTLIELLIVLVLIGLTTSFVLPNMWKQFDQAKLYSEKKQLRSIIQFAKEYSIYKGCSLDLVISKNFLEVYEHQTTLNIATTELAANDPFFLIEENDEIDNKVKKDERALLKRIDFTAFTLEPITHTFNADNYFQHVNVTIISKGQTDSEKIKI
ncbi:MAG: prepilin-type N-terminal cleavage/methylation domain-containing protein [Pseudoalteromonas sp.]